jgi:hypothetical protein
MDAATWRALIKKATEVVARSRNLRRVDCPTSGSTP